MSKWNWFDKYAGWYAILIVLWLVILFCSCSTNKPIETHDLLLRELPKDLAYKSITIKDYKCEEEC